MSRREAWVIYLKALGKAFLEVLGIPGAILLALFLLGIKLDPKIIEYANKIAEQWGAVILAGLVIVIGAETFYLVIKDDREKHERDFYAANRTARLERAHRTMYHLRLRGEREFNGDGEVRKKWDRDVRKALSEMCGHEAAQYYCNRTGRIHSGSEDRALSDEEMKTALRVIEGFLDTDFDLHFEN